MYNYTYDVSYLHIEGDAGDTAYRKQFLDVNNVTDWDKDSIMKNQDEIYLEFKDNEQFQNILAKAMENYQKIIPIPMDKESTLVLLFEYNIFECFHKCLKELKTKKKISDEIFTEINNLLS
jgi:hypothetical protein